ncbi:MAG TPA: hypothetical protein VFN35_36860 [Ktedonobacteraceae bacterium]|nr:hypothetical protein [Ktedonobacteraceae bacterium]
MTKGRLVPSTIPGRYAIGNVESGPDLSSGMVIEVNIAGRWVCGCVEHSMTYEGAGCYAISDAGRSHRGQGPRTEDNFKAAVRAAMQRGAGLEQAISAAEGRIKDVFCSYYLIVDDDQDATYIGLCTGMLVRLPGASWTER